MKKYLINLALVLVAGIATAQQRPQYTQYQFNNFTLNPAIAGIATYAEIKVGIRRQWVGLEGAPNSYYTSFHSPIGKGRDHAPARTFAQKKAGAPVKFSAPNADNRGKSRVMKNRKPKAHHGIGGLVQGDHTGPLSTTGAYVVYAYHLPVNKNIRVSMGTAGGFLQYVYNSNESNNATAIDPVIAAGHVSSTIPDVSMGTWIYSDNFFVGLSGAQLLNSRSDFILSETFQASGIQQKHYFITGGYKFENDTWVFVPSVMLKKGRPSPWSTDMNLRVEYGKTINAGISYRYQDAVAGMLGFRISPMWELGYSYDFTSSNLNKVSAGTHEIMLGFRFHADKSMLTCPQWLW